MKRKEENSTLQHGTEKTPW